MDILSYLIIGVGLSMDAFAISLTCGIYSGRERFKTALITGVYFGVFQALMPVIGFYLGKGFEKYIESFDHYVAFGILSVIGIKMIYESFQSEESKSRIDVNKFATMFILSFATSIDALACGISFAVLKANILLPAIVIGIVTFTNSFLGVYLGSKLGDVFRKYAEILGGLMLVGIGIKILIEHLF